MGAMRPLGELRSSGLLWLINRQVFHPIGLALGLQVEADGSVSGWCLLGDGSEVWTFSAADDDDGFASAVATIRAAQRPDRPTPGD